MAHPHPPQHLVDLLEVVLRRVFSEPASLLGAPTELPERPLTTERPIVARMAIHSAPLVQRSFPPGATVDVQYERVGDGGPAKRRGRRASPDLIFHTRGSSSDNFLAVEVKCRGHRRPRAWEGGPETGDLCKVGFFTHDFHDPRNAESSAYEWGVCLELDRAGADQWWMTRSDVPMQGYRVDGVRRQGPSPTAVHFQRWER